MDGLWRGFASQDRTVIASALRLQRTSASCGPSRLEAISKRSRSTTSYGRGTYTTDQPSAYEPYPEDWAERQKAR